MAQRQSSPRYPAVHKYEMLLNFDFDGVIADTFTSLLDAAKNAQALIGLGRPPTAGDLATIESFTFEDLALSIGIPSEFISQFREEASNFRQKTNCPPNFFPDTFEIFNKLSEIHVLTIISTSRSQRIQEALDHHGLGKNFSVIFGGETRKSKAEHIIQAQVKFNIPSNETVMIGDSISDIRQGKIANVATGAVLWGFQEPNLLLAENPDFIFRTPTDLLTVFAG